MAELETRKPSVRKRPPELRSGDRIIFSPPMGGQGEIVTVKSVLYGLEPALINVEELEYPIEVLSINTVKLA